MIFIQVAYSEKVITEFIHYRDTFSLPYLQITFLFIACVALFTYVFRR